MELYLSGVLSAVLLDLLVLSVHILGSSKFLNLKCYHQMSDVLKLGHPHKSSVESLSTVLLLVLVDHDAHYYTHYDP